MGEASFWCQSATPILDRLAPLPPPAAPTRGSAPAVRVIINLGICVVITALLQPPPLQTLRSWRMNPVSDWFPPVPWTLAELGVFLVSIVAATIAITVIHEAGHIAAGVGVGLRFFHVRVGPLHIDRHGRVTRYRGPGQWFGGWAALVPGTVNHLRLRAAILALGGPAANLLAAGVCLLLTPTPFSGVFVGLSLMSAVMNLVPSRGSTGESDGWHLLMTLRCRGPSERRLALSRLEFDIADGVRPEAWSEDFLALACAVRDESVHTVRAHGLAYVFFDGRGQTERCADALEVCLRYCAHDTAMSREALICDAAVFQGRRRGRADLAAQWLADLPDQPHLPVSRLLAEAAVPHARRDRAGTLKKLEEVEVDLQEVPNQLYRDAILRDVRDWKAEVANWTS